MRANNIVTLKTDNTEAQIIRARQLQHDMAVLKAEFDRIKADLVGGYFMTNDTFTGSEGLVLATYKAQQRRSFVTTEFKKDHPGLYDEYSVSQEINVFTVKK